MKFPEIYKYRKLTASHRNSFGLLMMLLITIFSLNSVNGASHVITRGDTLGTVAQYYGVSLKELVKANGIKDVNKIKLGQSLLIPEGAEKTSVSASKYTVQNGDTLSGIAMKFASSVSLLMHANNLDSPQLIRVGQVLKIPGKAPKRQQYVVRNGDSLGVIASRFGTTVNEILKYNSLSSPNMIFPGQTLSIYSGENVDATSILPRLSDRVKSWISKPRVKNGRWKNIVIHHSATAMGSGKGMDRYHKEERRMKNGLAYHFVIGNGRGMRSGEIYIGNRWNKQLDGGHLKSHALNQTSIGICLVGDFEKKAPSSIQMDKLEALVRHVMSMTKVPLSKVTTHKLIHPKHTLCPGKRFPVSKFKRSLSRS